jgi:amino acid adenylation domain-containing protein
LVLWETAAGLAGNIEYNCDLFEAATIARLADHFQILLEGIIADPNRRISALPLLPPEEQHQVLVEWNRTHADYPQDRCLHEWLAEQVARTPDATAAVDSEQSLTYAALNGRANQLAHHLQALHVGPETLVGICLERSVALVVAMLGILKAGGAYLPLDPNYPADRLRFMLEDAQVSVLLTATTDHRPPTTDPYDKVTRRQGDKVTEVSEAITPSPLHPFTPSGSSVVDLVADWETIARQPATNPISAVRPDNLAYVLYTSGSTGRPKGVAITQRSVLALLSWSAQLFPAADLAGMLAATSISFDLSVYELFLPLLVGGTVFLAENVLHLLTLPARHAITLVNSVPSAVSELLRLGDLPASVRTLNLAGEPLPRALAQQLYAEPGLRHLYNLYGPTEDTTYSTWALVARDDAREPGIGRPISNTVAYILDGALQPVPIGVAGELYLGGAGLARGYLGRPDLTAERFVPNPFMNIEDRGLKIEDSQEAAHHQLSSILYPLPSTRLYRTGDLARYRADGQIEYLGRIDGQVKLRGYRIELGEIATVLRAHPSVREAVAIVREDVPGDRRLVAYIVPTLEDGGWKIEDDRAGASEMPSSILHPPSSIFSELREFLKERLPDYMLPSAFVQLDALPLTPNGKLDRRALPGPEPERMIASRLIPPRDMLEFQLVQIWEEVLNVHPIGINDRFFELGGHSLLAVQLMSRVRQLVGVSLPLTTLFRHNTVEQLALALRQETAPATSTTLVGIRTGGSKRPFFCFHPLGGNVLCYTHLARHLGSEQPVYGLQSVGLEDDQAPLTQIAAMAAHYVEAIRTVQPEGPYLLGGWSVGGVIAVEVAQRLRAQGQIVALLALLDSYAPVSLERPPPDEMRMLADLAQQFELELDDASLIALEPDQRLAYVLEQAQRLNLALLGNDLTRIQRLFDVYKANASALHCYVPRPYHGRMTLFRADDGPGRPDPTLGWNELAVDGVELHVVPGGHYTMLREPDVRSLAEQLRHAIAQIQTPSEEVRHG